MTEKALRELLQLINQPGEPVKPFEIRSYGKSELAMLYFPDAKTKKGAMNNLNYWIDYNGELREKLRAPFELQRRVKASAQQSSNAFDSAFALHFTCIVKAKSDEASRNYGTFSQNNPFIPPEKAVLSSRLHRDTRESF